MRANRAIRPEYILKVLPRTRTGDTLTYTWSLISGPASVTIDNPAISKTSFLGVKSGTYRFMLTCADAKSSSTDTVNIIINNVAPSANAGSDMTVDSGTAITLHSVGSDPNDDALAYRWSLIEGPGIALPSMTTQGYSTHATECRPVQVYSCLRRWRQHKPGG